MPIQEAIAALLASGQDFVLHLRDDTAVDCRPEGEDGSRSFICESDPDYAHGWFDPPKETLSVATHEGDVESHRISHIHPGADGRMNVITR